jgi:Zn-finger protein
MQYMHLTPVTVLDNFFDDPDKVRRWALQQEYFPDPDGRWPGLRSKQIYELDEPFFQTTCRKFFSQFYDFESDQSIQWKVSMHFQTVHGGYDSGWIHSDEKVSQITGIIYLSPNSNLNGGTSIYREKTNLIQHVHRSVKHKEDSYKNNMTIEDAKKYKEEHNAQYEETIRVSNVYNRLVSFDSHLHHAAQDFFGEGGDSRLTLVFFVNKLFVNNTPVSRVRRTTE